MHGNQPVDRSEAVTQNIPKVLAAFVTGLVTVFGGALIYSSLQQSSEPVQVVQHARWERPAPSVEHPTPTVVPAQSLPENSSRVEDQNPIPPSTTAISPQSSARNTTVLTRPAESTLSARPDAFDSSQHASVQKLAAPSSVSSLSGVPPAGNDGLPTVGMNSKIAPKPLLPTLIQESKATPGPEHHSSSVEQPQRAASGSLQTYSEPVPSVPASQVVVVPASTTLEVQLLETLSSDHNRPGDTFRTTLASPFIVNGYLLAEAGTTVLGRVETSRRAPLMGGQAELSVTLTEIDTSDGRRTRVETGERKVKGTRNTLRNTAKMATGAAVGAVVGSVAGAAKGAGMKSSALEEKRESSGLMAGPRTASLPAGAQLTFILVAPFTATGTRPR